MIVYVAFKYNGVDPNGNRADKIIEEMTESCETMRIGFDANECWIDNVTEGDKADD